MGRANYHYHVAPSKFSPDDSQEFFGYCRSASEKSETTDFADDTDEPSSYPCNPWFISQLQNPRFCLNG